MIMLTQTNYHLKKKTKDLESMIIYFEELERYEDCALLVKVKKQINKHYKKKISYE